MRKITYCIFTILFFIFPMLGLASGSLLTLNVPDSVGDQYCSGEFCSVPDLVNMFVSFDSSTGAYTIKLAATEVNPFRGSFRININLFNVTKNSFFQDNMKDFSLGENSTTVMTLTGTNTALTSWEAGDQIYANNWDAGEGCTPSPEGVSCFRTAVVLLPVPESPFVAEDYINLVGGSPTSIIIERPLGALPASQCLNLVEINNGTVTEKLSMSVRNDFDGCIIENSVLFYKSTDCSGDPILPAFQPPDPGLVYKSGTRGGCAEAVEVTKASPVCVELTLKSGRKTQVCY